MFLGVTTFYSTIEVKLLYNFRNFLYKYFKVKNYLCKF